MQQQVKTERKPRQSKGANLAPINPPVNPDNLPAVTGKSELSGFDTGMLHGPKQLTRAERFPATAKMLAGFYAGLIPGVGDGITADSTTGEVLNFLELAHSDVQVSAQKMLPFITFTAHVDGKNIRVFDSVDMLHGEGYGDYMARVNRRAASIARRDTTVGNQSYIVASLATLEAKVWSLTEKAGIDNPSLVAPMAFGDKDVLLAVRRADNYVTAKDGAVYRMAQVLNLPPKETAKLPRVKITDAEKLTLYKEGVLAIAKKLAFVMKSAGEGDNPLGYLFAEKTQEELAKYNRFFSRLYKRLYLSDDILSLAERINAGEEISSL